MSKPLEGFKIIEIGLDIQGPFAGQLLADLGADVVKIENREGGDPTRWMRTRIIAGDDNIRNAEVL